MFQCIIQQRNGWIHNQEFRDVFPDIRLQLNEQLRCLDIRVETQISLIHELQEFYRRRGEIELDYSKSLEKMAKNLQLRHKEQKQKREQWPMFSSYACLQKLIQQTKSLACDHATLSEIYSTQLVQRLQTVYEDCHRIYKKCREIGSEIHEEILRVLQELHTTMKTYHGYQLDCRETEKKLRAAEVQRLKLQQSIPKEKLERNKKFKVIEKEVLKRKNKYTEARLKALKSKNEYQLCLEASNTTIHKYFVDDLNDLIDCMDLGFHSAISRALMLHVTADQGRCRQILNNSEVLSHITNSMDSRADKQKFLESYHSAFMIPKRLEFQGQQNEDPSLQAQTDLLQPSLTVVVEGELQKTLSTEMDLRLSQLVARTNHLRMESDEIWKTVETAETNLLEILNQKDYDCSGIFGIGNTGSDNMSIQSFQLQYNYQQSQNQQKLNESNLTQSNKMRNDKQEIEEFYLSKIREYILCTSRIARLDSKADFLRKALTKDSNVHSDILSKVMVPKRKRIGRMNISGRPKLFGGSLEEYLEATGEDIPLIIRSCIRVINLYGLHHQGIFRVSGSQVEISNFKEWFERGEDPLSEVTDASDINSIAGVFKLYLRELREPLFPTIYFDHFISLAQNGNDIYYLVLGIRKFLSTLSRPVICVMRYLFAFLNHLSEFSDENMMSAYNLAICFGPTLMRAPEDKDQVQYQNQVNALIENMIVHHDEIFPKDLIGVKYEKYISSDNFEDIDIGDSPTEPNAEDLDDTQSEEESDTYEATALFDFEARSERELSFKKGANIQLFNQISNDWWRACINGKVGLVADKFISLKIKGEDRDADKSNADLQVRSSSSEESVRNRVQNPRGNSSTPKIISTLTTTHDHVGSNLFDNSDLIKDEKKEIEIGSENVQLQEALQPFETSADYLDVTSKTSKLSISEIEPNVNPSEGILDSQPNISAQSQSNNIFDLKVPKSPNEPIYAEPTKTLKISSAAKQLSNEYQPVSIFQQNREQWESRANTTMEQANQSLIFKRNRLKPDLVMDLPQQDNTTPLSSVSTSAASSTTSLNQVENDEDMETLGDQFARQSQNTLKKNEKYLDKTGSKSDASLNEGRVTLCHEQLPKASREDSLNNVVLKIEEINIASDNESAMACSNTPSKLSLMVDSEKTPITLRGNPILTTGSSSTLNRVSAPTYPLNTQPQMENERASLSFGNVKSAISIKPQILTRKKSISLQAHSSSAQSYTGPRENKQ